MLTRFVRIQLILFAIAGLTGTAVMVGVYVQAPMLLGIGRMTIKMQMPNTGGLYEFSNVTYRGVEIGKVTEVRPTREGAEATLSLATSPKVPADLVAAVRSVSAVGEQYVDLQPSSDSGPYLQNGSVITADHVSLPQAVGPMLDQLSALVDSIPKEKLSDLLDESFAAFNGAGFDLGSLFDSASKLSADANRVAPQTGSLIDNSVPLLDGQAASTDAIRLWARSLAGVTGQLVADDPQFRNIIATGRGAAEEASRLFEQVKPTLPILLANMTTIGQIAVTYHPSIEQLLVLLPPYVATVQSYGLARNNAEGMSLGEFTLTLNDPPACTVGFLPPSAWRSPADESVIDTPDGLYCKLPQDSPVGVRGARNYPCMGVPGKRAATVQECDSDKPYSPLAMRQHATGAYPIDPGLISQGIVPDERINTSSDGLFGPVAGTPLPPPEGAGAPPAAPAAGPVAPADAPAVPAAPTTDPSIPIAAPSGYAGDASGGADGPSVAIVNYDPATGRYATPDGKVYRQADLAAAPSSWKDLLPTA